MRIRFGLGLWVLSFAPLALLVHANAKQTALIWSAQIVMGLVGLAIAGSAVASVVKTAGWRHAPAAAWESFKTGRPPQQTLPGEPGADESASIGR